MLISLNVSKSVDACPEAVLSVVSWHNYYNTCSEIFDWVIVYYNLKTLDIT